MPKWIFQKTSGDQQGVCVVLLTIIKFGALMAEQLVYKPHVLLVSPSFDLYPFPIWNNKWWIHNRRASLPSGWITASIIIHSWFAERATWPLPSKPLANLPEARTPGNNWHQRLPEFLPPLMEVSRNPTGTVLAQLLSVRSFITFVAKLDPIFLGWSQMWTRFSGSTGSGLALRFWKRVESGQFELKRGSNLGSRQTCT